MKYIYLDTLSKYLQYVLLQRNNRHEIDIQKIQQEKLSMYFSNNDDI